MLRNFDSALVLAQTGKTQEADDEEFTQSFVQPGILRSDFDPAPQGALGEIALLGGQLILCRGLLLFTAFHEVIGEQLMIDEREVPANHRVTLRAEASPELFAGASGADLLLLQGRPIGEPVVHYGPFVMNPEQEIRQAMADYRKDQFGLRWPWGKSDPVHPRKSGRFAKHADGKIERKG